MQLLIATTNRGKFKEISAVLKDLPIELIFAGDLKINLDFQEEGKTYEENALIKAEHFHKLTSLPCLADDSGIEVEALKGELGLKTRRWGAGEKANDKEWVEYFLKRMEKFPAKKDRQAKFISYMAVVGFGAPQVFSGEARGIITKTLEAPIKEGIPLSSCFQPDGYAKVYSALTEEEKNKISHRGQALKKVKEFLLAQICKGGVHPRPYKQI